MLTTVKIFVENVPHEIQGHQTTAAHLRSLENIPPDHKLFIETPGDDPDPEVPEAGSFDVHEREKFYAVPPGKFGFDPAQREVDELGGIYGADIVTSPDGQRYVKFEHFPLGEKWEPRVAPLAIRITGYPEAALDGFLVPSTVRLSDGRAPSSVSSVPFVDGQAWNQFSYHAEGPRVSKQRLRGYLSFVRQRLNEAR